MQLLKNVHRQGVGALVWFRICPLQVLKLKYMYVCCICVRKWTEILPCILIFHFAHQTLLMWFTWGRLKNPMSPLCCMINLQYFILFRSRGWEYWIKWAGKLRERSPCWKVQYNMWLLTLSCMYMVVSLNFWKKKLPDSYPVWLVLVLSQKLSKPLVAVWPSVG